MHLGRQHHRSTWLTSPPQMSLSKLESLLRIDILTSVSGVDFDNAWPNRLTADLDGLFAFVIGREELLQNKLASGRPKDLLDADILKSGES